MKRIRNYILVMLIVLLGSRALAEGDINILRISGQNRYNTAIEASRTAYKKSDFVVLASGENFPDALAGAPLAMALDAPILLTPKSNIPIDVVSRIVDLEAKRVYILGLEASISKEVEEKISSFTRVERIGGDSRYDTAALIAERVISLTGSGSIVLANGENFPDALASSSYFGPKGIPILLTSKDSVPRATRDFVNKNLMNKLYVSGGENSVSTDSVKALGDFERTSGANRFATSVSLAEKSYANPDVVMLVSGENFPDALSSLGLMKSLDAPLVLTHLAYLSKEVSDYLASAKPSEVVVVGGTGAVSARVVGDILDLYKDKPKPDELNFTPGSYQDDYARDLAKIINEVRKEKGIYPLVWDNKLAEAAKIRAKEVSQKLSHTRPDGSQWNTVNPNVKGENLSQFNLSPAAVLSVQMSLDTYSGNILRERSDFIGIGVACYVDQKGDAYWVQLYGKVD